MHPLTTPQLATGNRRRLEPRGCERGARRSRRRRRHRRVAGARAADACRVTEAPRRCRRSDRGSGARPRTHGRDAARPGRARPDARRRTRLRRGVGLVRRRSPTARAIRSAGSRLARRYLAGHGPADARDLAKWAGITLGDARLRSTASVERSRSGKGSSTSPTATRLPDFPEPRLLGPVRSTAPRVGVARTVRRRLPGDRDRQRTVPGVRARRRARVVATWGSEWHDLHHRSCSRR